MPWLRSIHCVPLKTEDGDLSTNTSQTWSCMTWLRPYASSWDLLDAIRADLSLKVQPFVVTTPNKKKLAAAVGKTSALEIARKADLRRILKAVEAASRTAPDA
jgi:hypothetical protein